MIWTILDALTASYDLDQVKGCGQTVIQFLVKVFGDRIRILGFQWSFEK